MYPFLERIRLLSGNCVDAFVSVLLNRTRVKPCLKNWKENILEYHQPFWCISREVCVLKHSVLGFDFNTWVVCSTRGRQNQPLLCVVGGVFGRVGGPSEWCITHIKWRH